jgi:hypothetical protein
MHLSGNWCWCRKTTSYECNSLRSRPASNLTQASALDSDHLPTHRKYSSSRRAGLASEHFSRNEGANSLKRPHRGGPLSLSQTWVNSPGLLLCGHEMGLHGECQSIRAHIGLECCLDLAHQYRESLLIHPGNRAFEMRRGLFRSEQIARARQSGQSSRWCAVGPRGTVPQPAESAPPKPLPGRKEHA